MIRGIISPETESEFAERMAVKPDGTFSRPFQIR
jgi:hypothetical protein